MSCVEKSVGKGKLKTLIDEDCLDIFSTHSWTTVKKGRNIYVVAETTKVDGKRPIVYLHRLITRATDKNQIVDHINGNSLDNRRSNLRITDRKGNGRNQHSRSRCGYKGVTCMKKLKKNPWLAQIMVNYKHIYLGIYPTPEDAAKAYDEAARIHFGAFGRYNFPREGEQKA